MMFVPHFLRSMMRPRLFLFLFYIWILFLSSCGTAKKITIQNSVESPFKNTFERKLPSILEKIPVNYELQYGFSNRDEFPKAVAGKSFNYFSYNGSVLEKSSTVIIPAISFTDNIIFTSPVFISIFQIPIFSGAHRFLYGSSIPT